jgi:hypothetical protein
LTPTPYALYAPSAGAAATAVTATTANSVAPGSINNTAIAVGAVDSSRIADGSIAPSDLGTTLLSSTFWRLDGNAGTTPGVNFIGTTDNQRLEIQVNGQRALRVEPDVSIYTTPNIIGGSANFVTNGAFGATIGGGGGQLGPNSVTNNFGTVAGGVGNISGSQAAVGGGYLNRASAINATVGGGFNNVNSGEEGTVGGGYGNSVSGSRATVPGGFQNTAAGDYSFAAGHNAKANHQGTFVWADNSTSADFASTANNQFLIRALGGVGIGTTNPASPVDILGGRWDLINSEGDFRIGSPAYRLKIGVATGGGGSGDTRIRAQGGTSRMMLGSGTNDVLTVVGTSVGIGTITPSSSLHVVGNTRLAGDLVLDRAIKVSGAGVGTPTAAFVQVCALANQTAAHRTTISNPLCDGNPNAILLVTHNFNPGGAGANLQTHPFSVWYNGSNSKWEIFNDDFVAMPVGTSFNVLIITP